MKTKVIIISAIILGTFALTAFVSSNNNSKTEYALFEYSLGGKTATVTYNNGLKENMSTKFSIDFEYRKYDSNFYYQNKVFLYLNEKGYKMLTHARSGGDKEYIFIKE